MKRRNSQQGVALVVTLILLSVITFMAVTFLVVSRHERERVTTQSSQSDAKFAAEAGVEQAKGLAIATMLARTNGYDFAPMVSTNYISPAGFTSGNNQITNVSYAYGPLQGGGPLVGKDPWQLMNNLQLLPRVPVYITTNKAYPPDFRYYLDLNRNGAFDTNGFGAIYSNGVPLYVGTNRLTEFFVGDPEWVGLLDKPEQRHSSSNLFVARYAFIALPIGNSLDINYIHNQAKQIQPKRDGFLRDQGFGSWELNLAAFLYTLNTNQWGGQYDYNTNLTVSSGGAAFNDAAGILRYRYNSSYAGLPSVFSLYGNGAANIFGQLDLIDGYLHGPVMTGIHPSNVDPDQTFTSKPWSGADNPQHFFSTQDLFTYEQSLQTASTFSNRLYWAGTNLLNSYDRYTFYRMVTQLGNGSAPESPDKLNLNYVNVNGTNATSFIPWTPVQFFTNAADKLLKDLATNDPAPRYPYPTNFGIAHIPIYPTNYYTPAVHRMLQLAANMYDAGTSRMFDPNASPANMSFPSVFRPTFTKEGTNVFVDGYEEEIPGNIHYKSVPLDLPADLALIGQNSTNRVNIYGIPYVIGAKKGFPNFNEFSMATVFEFSRRLQFTRPAYNQFPWQTNQMFTVGISNVLGVEAWNSYITNYPRSVAIFVTNTVTMVLTNSDGLVLSNRLVTGNGPASGVTFGPGGWPGSANLTDVNQTRQTLVLPLLTNVLFLPESVYLQKTHTFTTGSARFETQSELGGIPEPTWGLGVTNRLQFAMVDVGTGRLIDYVQLNGLDTFRDLTADVTKGKQFPDGTIESVWNTNRMGGNGLQNAPNGVWNQILIGMGGMPASAADWSLYGIGTPAGPVRNIEMNNFRKFMSGDPTFTTNIAQAPFTPVRQIPQYLTWQANDPLVHYTAGDLTDLTHGAAVTYPKPGSPATNLLSNLRVLNTRYDPWGGNNQNPNPQTQYNLAVKDPLVKRSDDWDFPTNKFPNIGWLGRMHRGTPWQTLYLKSSTVAPALWQTWSGNPDITNSVLTQPMNDWRLLDLFTVAQNDNASRGQLSINQTNLAAWAAVFQGVVTLTNATPGTVQVAAPLTPLTIDPFTNDVAFHTLVNGINTRRASGVTNGTQRFDNYPGQVFTRLGDILSVPELTVNSPFLNTNDITSLSDAAYERLPQQILSLLKVGEPRYVIYSYGQSLKPADRSIVQQSGQYFGICTNYQITGEVATRTVVRIENRPVPGKTNAPNPQVIVESFNVLPPE